MLRKNNGFTLVELLISMVFVGIIVGWFLCYLVLGKGNFWYTEEGVLKELRVTRPNVTEIVKTQRNVFSKSVITVKEDGAIRDFCLDSDIFWNYEFSDCSK